MTTAVRAPEHQCGHKHPYATRKKARQIARRAATTTGGRLMQEYLCPWCNWWHIGHEPWRPGK